MTAPDGYPVRRDIVDRPGGAAPPAPRAGSFLGDVLLGLSRPQKTLSPKYFYDLEGSRLFDEITRLPEYYPTRTELAILRDHGRALAHLIPPGAALLEFGSGSTEKIRILLRSAPNISTYVPIDVSGEFIEGEAARLRADLPDLEILPVVADFAQTISLPPAMLDRPRVGFFPGSTIGNFEPEDAAALLRHFAQLLGPGSLLILGVDLVKAPEVLDAAYDDAAGVTARFNLNLLARINRELGADFDLAAFRHRAFFNRERSRIEMHLVSTRRQSVRLGGRLIRFESGETIHTENSYKFTRASFAPLAARAGWDVAESFTDPAELFA
ncbi:MAG: hypothetical protein JWQ36_2596, partial [Enterovirga sp.]|nr:hypothetical protein [Enterovirga sp.]